ncbi:potassium channel subfamily T member 2-like isoform X4 [Ruditapes philippinarum]|uniref:potassium channel subfamily T member 2-like isoform X4 n=1 Tax=Ruditapes philippinarum TaxID=129788 RepID=UPI00295BF1D0|nr:potassium channel subfamily T member 2-like isoform X4 [Ruditapes philippinarum]
MDSSATRSEIESSNMTELYDDTYEHEMILNKRTFHLNLLDKTDINERELIRNMAATELIKVASDDSLADAKTGSAPVKYFEHDTIRGKLRRILIRNSTARLTFTVFDLIAKFLVCLLYMVRIVLDDVKQYECNGSPCPPKPENFTATTSDVNWHVILWVHRPLPLWIAQVTLAVITFVKTLLKVYVAKGNRWEHFLQGHFILEVFSSLPFIVTLAYPPLLRNMFVPSFLSCWLAKKALDRLLNDLHRTRQRFQTISVTLTQQSLVLMATMLCLIFTTICGVQHIQRASSELHLNLFDAIYFVIVTFSTVGYGDISPDIWPSRVFMILMICIAFAAIPMQIQTIASTMAERTKFGSEYSERRARGNKHVVVLSRTLQTDTVMDFLLEFYAHPKLEEHIVVLMATDTMDGNMQIILKDPKWSQRVVYMRGSASERYRSEALSYSEAEACFILAPRYIQDRTKADQHTILRSWAVKDFAPKCKQYIQLFKPENKIHVKFAEHVVCEDEFKYALLANNCLYPGLSTLVSLLVHTSGGFEGELATDQWQQTYGRHSGNEIYHIQLGRSAFFSGYEGKKFTEASADAHQRFGISLVAVLDTTVEEPHLQLNPGPTYILKATDFCFYMSVTKEEYAKIQPDALKQDDSKSSRAKNMERMAAELQRMLESDDEDEDYGEEESVFNTITIQQGYELASRVRRATYSADESGKLHNPQQSPTMDMHHRAVFNRMNSPTKTSPPKSNGEPVGEPLKKLFVVGHVSDDNPRDPRDNPDHFDHIDGTDQGQILGKYMDMDQDENLRIILPTIEEFSETPQSFIHEPVDPFKKERVGDSVLLNNHCSLDEFITGPPPVTLYVGSKRAICHLMKERRPICCLEWGTDCSHCKYKNTNDERWTHQLIILAAEHACNGIYNFIVPLRSQFIGMKSLCPIILLLEEQPSAMFLETMSFFPLVYWMKGNIKSVDDLLKAGINKASHLVVVNKEEGDIECEDTLADAETIVAVQTIFKLFPNANIITELNQASNMRFMHFRAHDEYSQKISGLERKLKSSMTSNLSHIFRLPFAAGQVFSASMLDTLLYQTFVKGYLITFVRLLLGIDAEENSGHLSSIRMKRTTLARYRTYGELYHALCSTTGEIPIALYRTDNQATTKPVSPYATETVAQQNNNKIEGAPSPKKLRMHQDPRKVSSQINIQKNWNNQNPEREDISDLIKNRMKSLDLSVNDYCDMEYKKNDISYVILNPSPKRKLRTGDLVYVLQPSSMFAIPTRLNRWKQRPRAWTPPPESTMSRFGSDPDLQKAGNGDLMRERTHSCSSTDTPSKSNRFKVDTAM